ncbi:PcfB family protein [Chakrabartyella piscis]|uniref:PcfB family protein n=1 Tax=Chakrabartyella piscis TaxID=2918914 RepID=UPI002958B167|nr:PcfB family protein [Chakrabartyella piscis]
MSVQEEVNHKNIAFVTSTTKITGRTLLKLAKAYLNHQKNKQVNKQIPQGKQSVKNLAKQGQGMTSLDLNDADIKKFDRIMKKYGIDYAVMTDKKTSPPTHTLFFKAKDADATTKAFTEFTVQATKKITRPSVLVELKKCAEIVKATVMDKVKNRAKEQIR